MTSCVKMSSVTSHKKSKQAEDSEIAELRTAFSFFDHNRDGSIEADELGVVMKSLGYQVTAAQVSDMIKKADLDGNDKVEFDEFVSLMKERSAKRDDEQVLRAAFKVFDQDGDGFISRNELRTVMRNLGEKLSEDELTDMIVEADRDGDGRINFDEFRLIVMRKIEDEERANA